MISVCEAVQLVLLVSNLLLDPLHAVHRSVIPRDLCTVSDLSPICSESLVDLVTKPVVAVEAEQLLIGVIRCGAEVTNGSACTSPWYTTPPLYMHPHAVGFTPM
jgi:hypothetical protein